MLTQLPPLTVTSSVSLIVTIVLPKRLKTITEKVTYVNEDGTTFTGTRPGNADQTITFDGTEYVDKTNSQLVHVKKDANGQLEINQDNHEPVTPTWTARVHLKR